MKILAIETSSSACSIALDNEGKITFRHLVAPMQHTKILLPELEELLEGCSLNTLDAIAYGAGPGSYTGIRIANSVVLAIARSHQLPIIKISSLAIMAQTIYQTKACEKAIALVDARMGQLYAGFYQVDENGLMRPQQEDSIVTAQNINIPNSFQSAVAIGDGWPAYQQILDPLLKANNLKFYPDILPHSCALLDLARSNWIKGKIIPISEAFPSYLR